MQSLLHSRNKFDIKGHQKLQFKAYFNCQTPRLLKFCTKKSLSCDKNHFLILTKIDQKNTLNMCLIFRFFLFFIFQFAELTWFTKQRRRIEILAKKKPKKRKTKKNFFSFLIKCASVYKISNKNIRCNFILIIFLIFEEKKWNNFRILSNNFFFVFKFNFLLWIKTKIFCVFFSTKMEFVLLWSS